MFTLPAEAIWVYACQVGEIQKPNTAWGLYCVFPIRSGFMESLSRGRGLCPYARQEADSRNPHAHKLTDRCPTLPCTRLSGLTRVVRPDNRLQRTPAIELGMALDRKIGRASCRERV